MNEMRKLMETIEQINDDMWPYDKPFPKKAKGLYDIANPEVEQHLARAAEALAKDAVEQAAGVYDEEGPGEGRFETGATTAAEYVSIAAPRFLTKDYKKTIIVRFAKMFDDYVEWEVNNQELGNDSR